MEDLILVNKGGRTVEVPNELGQELLEQGFRVATDEEKKAYQDSVMAMSPVVLKAKENQRIQTEKDQAEQFLAESSEPTATPAATAPVAEPSEPSEASSDQPKKRSSK